VKLNEDHIDYIIKDLNYRGIVADEIEEELLDHVCSSTEEKMASGKNFIEAYQEVLKSFGHTGGLRETQNKILESIEIKPKGMLKNYFVVALRNLRKQSFYSMINIFGLAVGVAACLVIVLFIVDELGFDKFNTKADRIYRVNNEIKFGGNHMMMTYSAAPFASSLLQDYPEIEATVRFRDYGSYLVKTADGTESIKERKVMWTDSTFFKIFSVKVLEGNPATALTQPASIAISKSIAEKYFPGKSALGQSLILDDKYNGKVTAVFEDLPPASHFHFQILVAMVGDWPVAKEAQSSAYLSYNFQTYLLLKEGSDAKALEKKFPQFFTKYLGPQIAQILGGDFSLEKFQAAGNKFEMTLTPLLDIHLHSDLKGEFEPNGSITYIYLFSTIAAFSLLIACINFMNLSTARSSNRAKEVGVRKVMGSLRSHLVRQFLSESFLVTMFAFLLAVGLATFSLPVFNDLASKQLHLPLGSPAFYAILFAAALVIGVIAGIYPSFFLSAFKPVNVLKGNVALGMKSGLIRSSLVVFQFVISIALIIGAITVNRQLSYIQNKKLGFEKNQVLVVHDAYALRPNVESFKKEALKISSIENGTVSGFLPVEGADTWRNDNAFWKEGNQPTTENMVSLQNWSSDFDYVKTLGMKIKSGRDFSAEFPSDSSAVILNERAVQQFELGEDPLGKKISTFDGQLPDGSPDPNKIKSWTVIGVVENFHFSSMKEGILPLGLFANKSDGSVILRFNSSDTKQVVESVEKIWKKMAPGQPFQYSFLNEDFGRMYASEQRLGKIFFVFAGLAIIIACLGLFALTAFTAEQRTKEIGIRKVMGASVSSIVVLLSKEFGKLILIAFVITTPIAWLGVDWWLKNYTYKTEIGMTVYILAGLSAFIIALITMGYQSIKAATNDPVRSLRSE
jgi:putative ABC transport system permease protein